MTHRIHIFNPDTDYALAADMSYYTAPSHVVDLRARFALLPAIYAKSGDAILLMDSPENGIANLKYYDVVQQKNLSLIYPDESKLNNSKYNGYMASPWGWNRQIKQFLNERFDKLHGIPDGTKLKAIRELSHRRNTIKMLKSISGISSEISLPVEIFEIEEGLKVFRENKALYFKAPWSSSGRGILLTDDLEVKHVEPWLRGIIRRQGSVIVEQAYQRILDFATEWIMEKGAARFLGFSVFNVSRRGKYHSNLELPQKDLLEIIKKATIDNIRVIVDCQKSALELNIGSRYDGPVGIDMLVTKNGHINPCVEMNIRKTMGMINLHNCEN